MFGNGHIESGVGKSFYRIGEVSRLTDTKPFVLRYWESEFPMLQPVKSPKGHRLYRRADVDTVLRIKRLLYDEGFTIAGARRHLREEGDSQAVVAEGGAAPQDGTEAEGGLFGGHHSATEDQPAPQERPAMERKAEAPATIGRKVLLDLRDALRAFLTLLENE
jgi:DNA-binding transcriptional MerR regulator